MLHLEVPCIHPLQPVHHSIRIVGLGSTDSIRQRVEQIETGNTDRKLVKIVLKVTQHFVWSSFIKTKNTGIKAKQIIKMN